MKPRNPVAGNAHRYNKASVIPNKKREAREEWLPEDEWPDEDEDHEYE